MCTGDIPVTNSEQKYFIDLTQPISRSITECFPHSNVFTKEQSCKHKMSVIWNFEFDTDPTSGRSFFVYRPTGESSWTIPPILDQATNSLGYDIDIDPSTGRVFFAEIATNTTFWEIPLILTGLTPGLSDDVSLLSDWIIEVDPTTGRSFFVQSSTGESAWEVPVYLRQGMVSMGWEIDLDDSTGRAYYTHTESDTVQWELPPTLYPLGVPTNNGMDDGNWGDVNTGLGGGTSRPASRSSSRPSSRTSSRRPGSRGTNGGNSRPSSSNAGSSSRPGSRGSGNGRGRRKKKMNTTNPDSDWQENKDSSGGIFWFNAKTGQVTTDKPNELKTEAELQKEEDIKNGIFSDESENDEGKEEDEGKNGESKNQSNKGGKSGKGGKGNKKDQEDRAFESIVPDKRTKEHWIAARGVAKLEAVWGFWEVWKETPRQEDEGKRTLFPQNVVCNYRWS